MMLSYLFTPVTDLELAAAFYRDSLGWEEVWREGDTTIAFAAPTGEVQVMLDTTPWPAGPMYLVPDLEDWLAAHAELAASIPRTEIPGGAVIGFTDPTGNAF
ncbi:hypothetical protein GCM10009792_25990 [Microcella alkalica]|uniref:Catechol 2,3-dioxygenase-like lactoylglutathione lyase family enzyme n=1 Tax=Microcella alkalica TaxID=355930 RepID=A0A839EE00_9MICO|nr:VOC family protein [Microcella alkalica]MBA8848474.1 catechol 2,3-dioxygenase-like lactoylglutathione lyase family enzyme [Microcella alkalica]